MIHEDCRGIACPEPIIRLKRALEKAGNAPVKILVDNGAPRENVLRFAKTRGCTVQEEEFENAWQITILTGGGIIPDHQLCETYNQQSVILVGSDRLGEGPEELGRLLMKNFIISLLELATPPGQIFFINRGVMLTSEGSELIEPLQKLADNGAEIFACGVCLDFFGLREKLAIGSVTNMYTIAEKMLSAGNTIRI